MATWRPLSERSIPELRAQAAKYRGMADTATTEEIMNSLRRLAEQLDEMADCRDRKGPGQI